MACDGKIDSKEVRYIETITSGNEMFKSVNVKSLLRDYVDRINDDSRVFFNDLFSEFETVRLSQEDELTLIEFAISTIEADDRIDYNEIKFFKGIRSYLKVSDEIILAKFPNKEDYIAQDTKSVSYIDDILFSLSDLNVSLNLEG